MASIRIHARGVRGKGETPQSPGSRWPQVPSASTRSWTGVNRDSAGVRGRTTALPVESANLCSRAWSGSPQAMKCPVRVPLDAVVPPAVGAVAAYEAYPPTVVDLGSSPFDGIRRGSLVASAVSGCQSAGGRRGRGAVSLRPEGSVLAAGYAGGSRSRRKASRRLWAG